MCASCGSIHGGGDDGTWESPVPDGFLDEQIPRPKYCPTCGDTLSSENCIYQEQFFTNKDLRLTCHPDGMLRLGGYTTVGGLEAKSINSKGAWEVRACPKLDHLVQLQCVLWLTGLDWGKVLYWDKGGSGLSALIEHTIEKDADHIYAMSNLIDDIWNGVGGGPLPEPICESKGCKRAQLCYVTDECFAAGL
jgi:hypothetical protein